MPKRKVHPLTCHCCKKLVEPYEYKPKAFVRPSRGGTICGRCRYETIKDLPQPKHVNGDLAEFIYRMECAADRFTKRFDQILDLIVQQEQVSEGT